MTMTTSIQDAQFPWHEGERRLQRRAGVSARMAEIGRLVIRDHLTDQLRAFFPQLPFVVIGAVDAGGDIWATVRAGRPGFLSSPDPRQLAVALPRDPFDPADGGMEDGAAIAMLGIELHTRRRNRVNGAVERAGQDDFIVTAEQAFGNCPRYIQRRDFSFVRDPDVPSAFQPAELRLDDGARAMIEQADTFFVASCFEGRDGRRQVDVSHRGGHRGFVRVDERQAADGGNDQALTIPDFAGNRFFNTLGNITANPRAGLVFVDFGTGDLLQMTGEAELLPDGPEIASFEGAERLWRFHPRRIIRRPQALPLCWTRSPE
jgi:uncharacterized protein